MQPAEEWGGGVASVTLCADIGVRCAVKLVLNLLREICRWDLVVRFRGDASEEGKGGGEARPQDRPAVKPVDWICGETGDFHVESVELGYTHLCTM